MRAILFSAVLCIAACLLIAGGYAVSRPDCAQQAEKKKVENSFLPSMGIPRIMPV